MAVVINATAVTMAPGDRSRVYLRILRHNSAHQTSARVERERVARGAGDGPQSSWR